LAALGDSYFLAFPAVRPAVAAADALCSGWARFIAAENISCPLRCAVHRGTIFLFRSFVFGTDINLTVRVMDMGTRAMPRDRSFVAVSEPVAAELGEGPWSGSLHEIEGAPETGSGGASPGRIFLLADRGAAP